MITSEDECDTASDSHGTIFHLLLSNTVLIYSGDYVHSRAIECLILIFLNFIGALTIHRPHHFTYSITHSLAHSLTCSFLTHSLPHFTRLPQMSHLSTLSSVVHRLNECVHAHSKVDYHSYRYHSCRYHGSLHYWYERHHYHCVMMYY